MRGVPMVGWSTSVGVDEDVRAVCPCPASALALRSTKRSARCCESGEPDADDDGACFGRVASSPSSSSLESGAPPNLTGLRPRRPIPSPNFHPRDFFERYFLSNSAPEGTLVSSMPLVAFVSAKALCIVIGRLPCVYGLGNAVFMSASWGKRMSFSVAP